MILMSFFCSNDVDVVVSRKNFARCLKIPHHMAVFSQKLSLERRFCFQKSHKDWYKNMNRVIFDTFYHYGGFCQFFKFGLLFACVCV